MAIAVILCDFERNLELGDLFNFNLDVSLPLVKAAPALYAGEPVKEGVAGMVAGLGIFIFLTREIRLRFIFVLPSILLSMML